MLKGKTKIVIASLVLLLVLITASTAVLAKPTDEDIIDPSDKFDPEKLFEGVINIIKWVVRLGSLVVVGAFIWLGFKLMRSAGNPKNRAEAMEGIQYVIYGAIFVFGAFFLQTGLHQLVGWMFSGKGPK